MQKIILLTLICLLSGIAHAEKITAAGCIVKADGRLLMVKDGINKRLSMPAGMIEHGETAEQAAVRETREESGVDVSIVKHYANWGQFALFHCKANSPILANPKLQTTQKKIRLYGYGATHIGTEIQHAYLVDIDNLPAPALRFPKQLADVQSAFHALEVESKVKYLGNNLSAAHPIHQAEIALIQRFQLAMGELTRPLFQVLNAFGESMTYTLLLPIVWIALGWRVGSKLMLLMLMGFVVNFCCKVTFGLPRPFDFLPALQSKAISGFGLPSGHTQTATLFWGFLYYFDWRHRFPKHSIAFAALALALTVGTGLSRLYFGVHFISDITTGFLLGCSLIAGFAYLDRAGYTAALTDCHPPYWMVVFAIVTVVTITSLSPYPWMVLWSLLALYIGLRMKTAAKCESTLQCSYARQLLFVLIATAGAVLLLKLGYLAREYLIFNRHIMLLIALQHFAIILWLTSGAYWLSNTLVKRLSGKHAF